MNPPVYYFLRSKIFRKVTQLQIRIAGPSLSESILQCRCWDSQAEFRIVLKHLWESFLNLRWTFIRAYNLHCNTYILSLSFNFFSFGLWQGGRGDTKHLPPARNRWVWESWSCYSAQEEWQLKSIPASGVLLKIKPDSIDKTNWK